MKLFSTKLNAPYVIYKNVNGNLIKVTEGKEDRITMYDDGDLLLDVVLMHNASLTTKQPITSNRTHTHVSEQMQVPVELVRKTVAKNLVVFRRKGVKSNTEYYKVVEAKNVTCIC